MSDEGTQSGARLPGVQVAVIGGASCSQEEARHAEEIGRRVALAGAVLLCGGTTGVMEAACRGAQLAGGTTVGILPGKMIESGNPWLSVRLPTGMGNGRNWLVAAGAHAVIAIGGGLGTLSEIALALKAGKPVVGLGTWDAVSSGRRALARSPGAVCRRGRRGRTRGGGRNEPDEQRIAGGAPSTILSWRTRWLTCWRRRRGRTFSCWTFRRREVSRTTSSSAPAPASARWQRWPMRRFAASSAATTWSARGRRGRREAGGSCSISVRLWSICSWLPFAATMRSRSSGAARARWSICRDASAPWLRDGHTGAAWWVAPVLIWTTIFR